MNNFLFENKTKVYFGKGGVKEYLGCLLEHYGDTVMLAYGGGSIKHNGVYDEIVGILNAEGKRIVEFPGIMPNPTYAKVQKGAKLARENHVDLILAVGGGSVSDCCKVVSAQAKVDEDLWELENTKHAHHLCRTGHPCRHRPQGCGRFHRADRRLLQEAEPRRTAGHPQRVQVIKGRKIQKELFIMEFITLNNGVKMPAEGIGTFLLTPDEAETAVLSALKDGARLIDTANAYCNEKAVGRAMKKSGLLREEIFLETKLWPTFYTDADAVDKTLARLDTDYIDLLLIHQPAGDYVAGYRLMEKAYKEGKVRAIGLSNFNEEQIKEILSICEVKPTILQTEVHPYAQQKELKAFLAENGMVIQAWYPLGHADKGLLEEPLFTRLAAKYGKSNVQIILRWHIQAGNVVIPGSKNPAHIHDNFDVFDFALTDAEMQEITTLNKDERYYEVTEDKLAAFATMFPPVDDQK